MKSIARIRPSNLVILSALPFVIYLFTMVPNYRRSIVAIVGIERGAPQLFVDFVTVTAILALGLVYPFLARGNGVLEGRRRIVAMAAVLANVVAAAALAAFGDVAQLASSIIANAVDAETSNLVAKGVSPRDLTPEGHAIVAEATARHVWQYLAASAILALPVIAHLAAGGPRTPARWAARGLILLNGAAFAYLILSAHLGFAAGLFTTLRAGIFGYILACCLGLLWAGLLHVTPTDRTIRNWSITCVLC
ncbi:MAG: hypothetical protein KDE02_05975, partial [Rhodobacteraceae bacterium]|nr:hypothetical protein [Paracoccaceae bacterium]